MAIEDRIEKPYDANAPKVLDRAKCQRMIRTAPSHARFPLGDVLREMADQLKCAIDELENTATIVNNARNETIRYQHESNIANAEVKTMQALLVAARDERDAALKKMAELKPAAAPKVEEPAAPAEVPAKKKRGRPAKVVQMDAQPQQKAAT